MAFRIYTKTGDKGTTALIGGTRVPKSDLRIESYGTIDELNSYIGLCADLIRNEAGWAESEFGSTMESGKEPAKDSVITSTTDSASISSKASIKELLREIQDRLFTIGSCLAVDPEKETKMKIPDLKNEDVELLEQHIDYMDDQLPVMKNFILPGGHPTVSHLHIARTICRRSERLVVALASQSGEEYQLVITYLNRLSDYLFTLARFIGQQLGVQEIPWKARKA